MEIDPADARPPASLEGEAAEVWRYVYPVLRVHGLITQLDRDSLACYCQAVAEFRWCNREIKKQGRIVKAANGTKMAHPAVSMRSRASEAIRAYAQEFGLSPSARTGLELKPKGGAYGKEASRFFGGGNA